MFYIARHRPSWQLLICKFNQNKHFDNDTDKISISNENTFNLAMAVHVPIQITKKCSVTMFHLVFHLVPKVVRSKICSLIYGIFTCHFDQSKQSIQTERPYLPLLHNNQFQSVITPASCACLRSQLALIYGPC